METREPGRARSGVTEPAGLAPVRAFFAVGVLATVIVGVFMTTREATPREPAGAGAGAGSPDYALTDAEAIAEFERLRTSALDAVRTRDVSLIDEIATPDGPLRRRAAREIAALVREDVVDETEFFSLEVDVVRNDGTEILVLERSRIEPCFRARSGRDVSSGPAVVRQAAHWTLRLVDGDWLLHKAAITADEAVDSSEAACD